MYGQATVEAPSTSPGLATRSARWAGRVVSALVVAFLAFDGITKAMMVEPVVEATTRLGYPAGSVFGIGATLLVCTALYAVPRTAFLGAILLTGYLGGAVATQVRVEDPWFLFPAFIGVLAWGGLFLRDARVRALVSK
jgi:DoxX-like protein